MVRDTKLYDILEIKPDADANNIRLAYKKLAFKWHPDKNQGDDTATKKFQEISEAYSILSDPDKRERYNMEGYDNINNNNGGMPNQQDIFNQFFGGNNNFFGRGGQSEPQNTMEHCVVEQEVSLEDLMCHKTINVTYKQKNYCKKCNGNGTKDGTVSKCPHCKGSGKKVQVIQRGNMIQQMIGTCNDCNGSGETPNGNNKCDDCKGSKFLVKDITFEIQLNKNLMNGNKMEFEHKGNIYKTQKTNLIIVIKEKPHALYKRNGKDLHINMKLRLFQALFGFTKHLTHLDGRTLIIKNGSIKKFDTLLKIKNEGMGGDLFIHITTSIPNLEKIDKTERITLKEVLIKTNMTEFQKENLLNTKTHLNSVLVTNIEEILIDEEVEEPQPQQYQQQEGVQCAQQ